MSVVFVERVPTAAEVEQLRLLLSTYQDGTGMLTVKGRTLPGWRDFERVVATVFGGVAVESKAIFDVLLADPVRAGVFYGISCKMRGTLDRLARDGRLTIELSNSAKKFWQQLAQRGFDQTTYQTEPLAVGCALIELVESWQEAVSGTRGGHVDLTGSSYLILSWSERTGWYQLHRLPIQLPDPRKLRWHFPTNNRLVGTDDKGLLFEWYGGSGGQLKYYPPSAWSTWQSAPFRLEPLTLTPDQMGLIVKAAAYFPALWAATTNDGPA